MTHREFVQSWRQGALRANFDRARAGQYLSARLLLPLFMLPLLGGGVALVLLGYLWTGLTAIALGIAAPRLIKRSAPHFLLTQALQDESVFNELSGAGILRLSANHETASGKPQ